MTKPVVGLTGGIACGKSTIARMFSELGVPLIDADGLAREVVLPGTEGLKRVMAAFGNEVVAGDGTLDRKKLAAIVFNDQEARETLNAITHPLIATAGVQKIASFQSHTGPFILYEAALLVETGTYSMFDALVVVSASPEVQLDRLTRREGLTEPEAKARINSQFPLEEKEKLANFVIRNNGSYEEAREQVLQVYDKLVQSLAQRATS